MDALVLDMVVRYLENIGQAANADDTAVLGYG